jgi:hypothetical protein
MDSDKQREAGLLAQAEAALLPVKCWSCQGKIGLMDNYCRYCGKGQGSHASWYYKHWGIILSALMIGPFVLFYVWRSPLISRTAKIIYTVLILTATWWLFVKIKEFASTLMGLMTGSTVDITGVQ